ncbi:hypothetical protein Tco_1168795, partial [Tanacetum coccineum]
MRNVTAAASPTAQSPDYVLESYPETDPEEDDDEDPKEDPVDYLADGSDDGDDEDGSSEDDEDDDMDIEADDGEEEEEHPAPADSVVVALPATDQHHLRRRQSTPVPTPVWSDAEVARLLAVSTPPSSSLSPWSSPLPQIPSPPLPLILSPLLPPLPQIPSPLLPVSLLVPVIDRPEVTLLPRKRLCIALGPRYEVRESSSTNVARPSRGLRADYGFVSTMDREIRHDLERDVGYGITDSWDEIVEAMQRTPVVIDV